MNSEEKFKAPVVLFYSYSHKDEAYREELEKHLTTLRLSGLISDWHDRKILAGDEWDKKISEYLEKSYVILLLISSDFVASKYCYDIEAARALERYNKGEAILIPIILRPVKWDITPFGKIQALPKNAQPVTQWADRDSAYLNICEGILALLTSVKSESKDTTFTPIKNLTREKVLDAALPEQVAVGKTIALVVLIRGKDSEGLKKILRINTQYGVNEEDVISTGTFPLDFSVDESGKPLPLELNIKIESPDFEQPTQTKSIKILPDGDSEPRIFLLTPNTTGDLIVNLEVYSEETLISGCLLRTKSSQTISETNSTNLVTVPINFGNNVKEISSNNPPNINPYIYLPDNQKNFPQTHQAPISVLKNSSWSVKNMATFVSVLTICFVFIFGVSTVSFLVITSPTTNVNSTNNMSVTSNLNKIHEAQITYASTNDSKNYGTLKQLRDSGLIDETLASGEKNGYSFSINVSEINNKSAFDAVAEPLNADYGDRSFYINEDGKIYYVEGKKAGNRVNPGIPLN